jgi:hypothetical protein
MDAVIGDSPFPIFERRDCQAEFEFQRILGMKE